MTRRRRRDQRGSALPMIIVLTGIVLLLVAVVVDAGAAYLGHQQLDSVADGAALRGADAAAEGDDTYRGGLTDGPLSLDAGAARAAVLAYLRDTGALRDHPGLRVEVRQDGDRVVVEVRAPQPLPLHLPGAEVRPVLTSTGSAEVRPDLRTDAAQSPQRAPT